MSFRPRLMSQATLKQHLKPNSSKKLGSTETELKNSVAYKKICLNDDLMRNFFS